MVERALRGPFAFMINTNMRAYEILNEYEFPEIKARKPRARIPDRGQAPLSSSPHRDSDPNVKVLGRGSFSTAYVHKDAPQDVTKGSRPQSTPDGYEIFFRSLAADKNVQTNPYFPHFRNINTFSTKDSGEPETSYMVKIERLWSLYDLEEGEEDMLLNKMFTRRAHDYFGKAMTIDSMIDNIISDMKKINDEWIKDPHLLEALLFIRTLAAKYNYHIDLLTSNNIMFRRTSVGPQVVINDPLGWSDAPGN